MAEQAKQNTVETSTAEQQAEFTRRYTGGESKKKICKEMKMGGKKYNALKSHLGLQKWKNVKANLTQEQQDEIKSRLSQGQTQDSIGKVMNVRQPIISDIAKQMQESAKQLLKKPIRESAPHCLPTMMSPLWDLRFRQRKAPIT